MQPTYLPWSGYFNLMASVDRFVLLDDVQFERRSWQSRNRILLQGKEHYLIVPVRKAARDATLNQISIDDDQDWRSRHLQSLRHAYGKAPHGRQILELIESVFACGHRLLAELNQGLIAGLADCLGLQTTLVRASALNCGGKRSEHLAEICRALACSEYLSPPGSRDYLMADQFATKTGIGLYYQNYVPSPYPQQGTKEFVSHLSIVDVLAHCGREAARQHALSGGNS